MFGIALLNPLRFIDTSEINFGFDGNFAIDQVLSYQNPKCYFQKWQSGDTLNLQILSDYEPSEVSFIDVFTGAIAGTGTFAEVPTLIVGQTFKVYELQLSFTALPLGKYYAEFEYTDENEDLHTLISEPICISTVQDHTLLIKYKHSENDYDVIFDTDIEFQFRVEAAIKDFDPKNSRIVYNDQKYNSTQLSATPYRAFKLFVGYQYGVPEWVVDKVNRIQSVDQVSYNNIPYQVPDGAEFESTRNEDNNFMGSIVDVRPVDNNFKRYTTQPNDSNEFIPMQKIIPYYGVSVNIAVAGKFKAYSDLEKICVTKRSAGTFTLLVGTSLGGDEIATFIVDEPKNIFTIEWEFDGTSNLYLSGLAGADCDVFIVYKQLDEPPIPNPIVPAGSSEGKGSSKVYHEVEPGDLAIHWDLATGIGRANTAYVGWAWADGRNGTPDWRNRSIVMMDESNPDRDTSKLGTPIGADSINLTKAQLPAANLGISVKTSSLDGWRVSGGSGRPIVGVGNINASDEANSYTGTTENMGEGAAIPIIPKGSIEVWIIKLID